MMTRDQARPFIAHCLDNALCERNLSEMPANARLVGWQCGFEPMFVAVWSYLGDTEGNLDCLDPCEAEEIATDYLRETGWFASAEDERVADYVI